MQVYGYKAIAVETMDKELTKATLVEEDRLLQHVEEGNLLDLDLIPSKPAEARSRQTANVAASLVAKSKPVVVQPEESIEDLTSSLINEISTHQLEVHLDHVAQKLRNAHYATVREAKALLEDVTAAAGTTRQMECTTGEKMNEFHERAESIKRKVQQLAEVASKKAAELKSTSGSQSGSDTSCLSPIVEDKLAKQPWTTCIGGGGGAALTLLSDIFLTMKAIEHGGQDEEEVWVAPQAFERATQKFWVKEEHLTEVMLACVSEVPLLVYGKSGRLHEDHDDIELDVDLWESHVATISSVYFDSPSLDLYKGRIARIEGAKLVRVRWYGAQPKGHAVVFLELKTHHESWVMDNSTKQRVAVQEQDMVHVMSTTKIWTVDFAESLVRAGNPNQDKKTFRDAVNLLLQIHDLVVEFGLRPCVRTCYRRAAFQSSTSNELRLTIDRDIVMTDERGAPPGAWCFPTPGAVILAPHTKVPVAVFEVKLAGSDRPAFMDRLIGSGIVRDGYKFSKFLTGVATFHSDSDCLAVLPYWADDPMFAHMFRSKSSELDPAMRSSETPAPKYVTKNSESTLSTLADGSEHTQTTSRESRSTWMRSLKRNKKQKRMAPSNRVKIEPKTYFAAERTFIQWISAALMLITVAAILLSFSSADGSQSGFVAGLTLTVLAVVVTLYALVVYFRRLYLLEHGQAFGYTDHMGPPVLAIAVAAGIGAAIYVAVRRQQPVAVSTAALIAEPGKCMKHGFHGIPLLEYQPSDVVLDEISNSLIIPSQSKLTAIPLGTPESTHEIKVLIELFGFDMESVAYVNGTLYALAEDKDVSTLLAFEWQHNVFKKENDLQLVGRWDLKGAENAEGLVYVPDLGGGGPKLLVSGDGATTPDGGVMSNILVFNVPATSTAVVLDDNHDSDGILKPCYQLNAGLFTFGMTGDSKIAAMTYFEDVLYVLHDNARVIRGWNVATATMVSEWSTPRAGGQHDKQWEGLTLQRAGDFSIVAHMTLDTPPQIWSFVMDQSLQAGNTSLSFPACAQAY